MSKLHSAHNNWPKNILSIGLSSQAQADLQKMLDHEAYQLRFCDNCSQAIELIETNNPSFFSAYLLDEAILKTSDFKEFQQLRNSGKYNYIPTILQLKTNQSEAIQQGLNIDMFFYLISPYSKGLLLSVLEAATLGFNSHQEISRRLENFDAAHPLLQQAVFHLQTVEEAQTISSVLAYMTPEPKRVGIGLFELMLNAIEHGNLQIGYQNKTALIKSGNLQSEISKRLRQHKFKDRFVAVTLKRSEDYFEFTISDKGEGFDVKPYLDFSEERAMDNHGRGIMIANRFSFDSIEYQDQGSTVICRIKNQLSAEAIAI